MQLKFPIVKDRRSLRNIYIYIFEYHKDRLFSKFSNDTKLSPSGMWNADPTIKGRVLTVEVDWRDERGYVLSIAKAALCVCNRQSINCIEAGKRFQLVPRDRSSLIKYSDKSSFAEGF
jgi:hypothetical protein